MQAQFAVQTNRTTSTFADIEALIREEAEEGLRLELKRSLPANDRDGDPWMKGAKRFSNPARDGLAKEIVALANAYGGAVVVGIDETDDHPKRARGPDPVLIPRIAACAEQMQQALDNLIDPPLAVFEVRGIEQPGGDGEGVLIIRTGSSTRAPHGHGRPPLAYMRRGSRSEPMTMRDLQSVLFETRTRGERVSALLDERQRVLAEMVRRGPGSITVHQSQPFVGREAVWFRCTLVATEDLHLRADDLSRKAAFIRPRPAGPTAFGEGGFVDSWRPRLGGVENFDSTSRQFGRWFIGDHGIVDAYGFVALDKFHGVERVFPPELFPPVALQVIALGERLRRLARRPEVELAIECEFLVYGLANAMPIGHAFADEVPVTEGATRIGPYSLGNFEDWQATFAQLERGIWHGLGLPIRKLVTFELERWLAETHPGL
ncbi:helix-turn-helix domain-containing protein [Methylobacterium persicinum]